MQGTFIKKCKIIILASNRIMENELEALICLNA